MKRITKLSLLLTLLAGFCAVGCKSDEDNPVTPEVLKKIDAGRSRGEFKPDMSGKPAAPAAADPRSMAPGGSHASPSGN